MGGKSLALNPKKKLIRIHNTAYQDQVYPHGFNCYMTQDVSVHYSFTVEPSFFSSRK
jgi:hypothetical protein